MEALVEDSRRARGGRQVPGGAVEQVRARVPDARGLGAGERMAAHELRCPPTRCPLTRCPPTRCPLTRANRRDDRALGRADVRDHAVLRRRSERRCGHLRQDPDGRGDEHRLGTADRAGDAARARRRSRRARAPAEAPRRSSRSRRPKRRAARARRVRSSRRSARRRRARSSNGRDPQTAASAFPATSAAACTRARYSGNSSATSCCGPSQIAWSGCGWTSTMIPSAPAAAAASESGSTRSRRPAAWLGSTITGRWLSSLSTGTAIRSSVKR